MGLCLSNPEDGKKSISLSIAVYSFLFSVFFTVAALVASWVTGKPEYLGNVAGIVTAFVAPCLGTYLGRAWTKAKFDPSMTETNEK